MSLESIAEVVDAHHHLWDLEACRYPWLMAKGVRRFFGDPGPIQKNYLVADFRTDASDVPVTGSVHVQVGVADGEEVNETAWLQASSDRDGLPSAVVAYCDLSAPLASQVLERQQAFPALRGIRQIVGRSREEDAASGSGRLLANPDWRRNLSRLVEAGLSFDLQMIPDQMPGVLRVLTSVPDLSVALCHCGSPWDQSSAGLRAWRQGLEQLAQLPNLYCKLSGFSMFDPQWTEGSLRPLIHTAIDVFSPQRCMFGSNFPVDKLYTSYSALWQAYSSLTADLTAEQRACLFSETARQFYRLV